MRAKGGDGRELERNDNQQKGKNVGGIAANALRSIVNRIERLEDERRDLLADIREIRAEAKGQGFDPKVINFIIRERRKDPDDVDEFNTLVDTYKLALENEDSNEESL